MSKPFPYWLRLSIVSTLSVLLSFNPSFAGRFMHRASSGGGYQASSSAVASCDNCQPMPSISPGCDVPCCGAIEIEANYGGGCGSVEMMSPIAVSGCGCGASISVSSTMPCGDIRQTPSVEPIPSMVPAPSVTPAQPFPAPSIVPKVDVEPRKSAPPKPKPTPVVPKPEVEPKPVPPVPSADDLFGAPPPAPKPTEPVPVPAPQNDLFSTPPAIEPPAKPVAPPAEDLFSPPEPAMKPAVPADDLFAPPKPSEPATKPADSTAPVDDIFGKAPSTPNPAPANPADDLFGPSVPEKAPTPPAGNLDVDDLFKSSSAEPQSDQPIEISQPVSTAADSEPNFDDLFANPSAMSKEDSRKASELNSILQSPIQSDADKKLPAKNSFDDLFKSTSTPTESNFRGAEFREWVDNTGDYSVNARLVVIYPDRVRLIKENGKFTSVPVSRLSEVDRDYVNWVTVSLSKGPSAKFVNTETIPSSLLQDMAR